MTPSNIAWVPSAVVRTVTQTMIPKSLLRLGRTAKEFNIATDSKFALEGDEWLPPVVGSSDDTIVTTPESEEDDEEGDSEDDDDDESDSSTVVDDTSSISKDLASLLAQLRSLTGRLSTLESSSTPSPATSAVGTVRKLLASATGIDQRALREAGVYLTAVG